MEAAEPGTAVLYEPAAGDVWSCGVVLLELLGGAGRLAAELGWGSGSGVSVSPSAARAREVRGLLKWGAAEVFSSLAATVSWTWGTEEEVLTLLAGTLAVEPRDRWTAAELEGSAWLRRG